MSYEPDKNLDKNDIESNQKRRLLQVLMAPQRRITDKNYIANTEENKE